MSHSVTITRTTTTATGHSLFINSGYLSSLPGLLKLAELLLGAAIVGILGYYFQPYYNYYGIPWKAELFMFLISTSFLIGTFCLLTSRMVSLTTSLSDNVHLLGAACVGVVGYYFDGRSYNAYYWTASLFFFLISTAFLIGTFCLLLSRVISLTTSLSDNVHEVIYHGLAFVLYLAAGLTLIIELNHNKSSGKQYEALTAAAVMGLVNAGLYLVSTFLANRAYRGI